MANAKLETKINATINGAVANSAMFAAAPKVTDLDSLNRFGKFAMQNPDYINEFANLINRIAEVVVWNKAWENPLRFLFKDGEYGDSIEEIFVNTAQIFGYDPYGDGAEQWKRVAPDVRAALHKLNVEFFTEQTVYDRGLKRAFLSYEAFSEFFQGIITSMYNALSKALYEGTMYVLAKYIISTGAAGTIIPYTAEPKEFTVALKSTASKMNFLSTKYNAAGVETFSNVEDMYLLVTPDWDATQEVDVFAYMFQVDRAEVPYRKIVVNSFSDFNYKILDQMFVGGVDRFGNNELEQLKNVKAMLIDRRLLILYDMMHSSEAVRNKRKLYENYYFHFWGTMSYSPFANGYVFATGEPNTELTGWKNPYAQTEITVGRDNMFYVQDATAYGMFTEQQNVEGTVTGEGLIPIPEHPGWYLGANKRGATAQINYEKPAGGSASMQDLTVNITIV